MSNETKLRYHVQALSEVNANASSLQKFLNTRSGKGWRLEQVVDTQEEGAVAILSAPRGERAPAEEGEGEAADTEE